MRTRLTWRGWSTAGALCFSLALTGCGSQTRHRLLHVFFTGVDQPAASSSAAAAQSTNAPLQAAIQVAGPTLFVHQPYAEQKCSACHLGAQSQELRPGGGEICLECHTKLKTPAKYVHAPFGDGSCGTCHTPHQSEEPHLLSAKGQGVCTSCHELNQIRNLKGHAAMGGEVCWKCHDPHSSDQKNLVRAE